MKKWFRFGLTAMLCIAFLCALLLFYNRKSFYALFLPQIKVNNEILIKIQNDTAFLSVPIVVTNKVFFKIRLDTIRYSVSVLNKVYLNATTALGIVLGSHSTDTIIFPLKIHYTAILRDFKQAIKTNDSVYYEVNVILLANTLFGKIHLPIHKVARIKIPIRPEIEIEKITWITSHRKRLSAMVKIKIANKNKVSLRVLNMKYALDLNKFGTFYGEQNHSVLIKPLSVTHIELPVLIHYKHLGRIIFEVLTDKDEYNYKLKIKAELEFKEIAKSIFIVDVVNEGKYELVK